LGESEIGALTAIGYELIATPEPPSWELLLGALLLGPLAVLANRRRAASPE
jgi:hypothetical protein